MGEKSRSLPQESQYSDEFIDGSERRTPSPSCVLGQGTPNQGADDAADGDHGDADSSGQRPDLGGRRCSQDDEGAVCEAGRANASQCSPTDYHATGCGEGTEEVADCEDDIEEEIDGL